MAEVASASAGHRCRPHLLRPLPRQCALEGALPAGLAGHAAKRRPWKIAINQPFLGWLALTQTPPQARVKIVRPARPSTFPWPTPPAPNRAAATCLPVCLSKALSRKSPPYTVSPWQGAGVGSWAGPVLRAGRSPGPGNFAWQLAWGKGWPCWVSGVVPTQGWLPVASGQLPSGRRAGPAATGLRLELCGQTGWPMPKGPWATGP